MSAFGSGLMQDDEKISKTVRNPSIMRGIDRTILKSISNTRLVGLFVMGCHTGWRNALQEATDAANAAGIFLASNPAGFIAFVQAFYPTWFHELYVAQRNYHLEIDEIVYADVTPLFTTGNYNATNHPLALTFKNTPLLPPNKNVYIRRIAGVPPFNATFPNYYNFFTVLNTQINTAINVVMYDKTVPTYNFLPNIYKDFHTIIEELVTPSNQFYHPPYDNVYILRTDANGKLPNITDKFLALDFPNDTKDYFQRVSQQVDSEKYEIRVIKDRYDCGEGSLRFTTRRYQELVDNEWDTKVLTDA